ncbi:MAG TPA: hypothetical protein VFW42_06395 [Fluviicoccus sp.]|nr:hypothetical protein [Fluviicoccus sp.]
MNNKFFMTAIVLAALSFESSQVAQATPVKIILNIGERDEKAEQEEKLRAAAVEEHIARNKAEQARLDAETAAEKKKGDAEAAQARAKFDAEIKAHYERCAAKGISKEKCGSLGTKQ